MSDFGGFGIAMLLVTVITVAAYLILARIYRSASGLAALGPGILMMLWRGVGGIVGVVLGFMALLRGEPGTVIVSVVITLNLVFALSLIYKMLRKRFCR